MKRFSFLAICAMAVCMFSCKNAPAVEEDTPLTAVDRYLTEVIGSNYLQGEYCIPCPIVVKVDDSNPEDIRVYGDFWVFNYEQAGDTLKMVSGGSHPGLMHVAKTDKSFEVKSFDAVADGALFLESAKSIFGEDFEAFSRLSSDENYVEAIRKAGIADYVKEKEIPVTMYQDYGWEPISLE